MRVFQLQRDCSDATVTSGSGNVLEGVQFNSGKVAVEWKPHPNSTCGERSIGIYQDFDAFYNVHVKPYLEVGAEVTWDDPEGYNK